MGTTCKLWQGTLGVTSGATCRGRRRVRTEGVQEDVQGREMEVVQVNMEGWEEYRSTWRDRRSTDERGGMGVVQVDVE